MADRVGQRLGNNHLIRLLGRGGSQKFTSVNHALMKVLVLPLLIRECTHVGYCAHGTTIDLHTMYDNRNARSD